MHLSYALVVTTGRNFCRRLQNLVVSSNAIEVSYSSNFLSRILAKQRRRHDLFTIYVFTVVDAKTGVVLLSGKLSSLGGTVAGKVAKRFVKEMPASAGP